MTQVGTGVARGSTANGFPGRYKATYYSPNGRKVDIFQVDISQPQETYHLTWSNGQGQVLYTGVGIEDDNVLSAAYIKRNP